MDRIRILSLFLLAELIVGCNAKTPTMIRTTPMASPSFTPIFLPSMTASPSPTGTSSTIIALLSPTSPQTLPEPKVSLTVTPSVSQTLESSFSCMSYYDALSPGGYIVYKPWNEENSYYVVSDDGRISLKLAEGLHCLQGLPGLSGDGRYLAFLDNSHDSSGYFISVFDMQKSIITDQFPADKDCNQLSWSPDNAYIVAACRDVGGGPDKPDKLYIFSMKAGITYSISPPIGQLDTIHDLIFFPAWSPDGRWIAYMYSSYEDPNQEPKSGYYIVDTTCLSEPLTCQENTRRLLESKCNCQFTWSPDSLYLAIERISAPIILVDIKSGETQEMVTDKTYYRRIVGGLAWSPDGKWLAFGNNPSAQRIDIYLSSFDGGEPILLKENAGEVVTWITISNPFRPGNAYTITVAGHNLNLRDAPTTSGSVLRKLQPGDTVTILQGPIEADGYSWWKMRTSDGLEGWAVDIPEWYEPVSTPTLTPTPGAMGIGVATAQM